MNRYKHSCKQVHFHTFTSIRRLFALQLPWLHCLFFERFTWGWALHALHPEEGWLYNTLLHTNDVAEWSSAIIKSVMLGNAWVVQVCVSQLHQDELAVIMPPLQDRMWVTHGRSLLCELLPDEQFQQLRFMRHPM